MPNIFRYETLTPTVTLTTFLFIDHQKERLLGQ